MFKKLTFTLSLIVFTYFLHAEEPSLRFKLGQMLIIGFHDTAFHPYSQLATNIARNHVGGIIFYGRNILNPSQLQELIKDIKTFSSEKDPSTPLFIAIDHEGGFVNRLKLTSGFHTFTLSHATLGILNDTQLTFNHASQMAEDLHSLGFNLNLGPVVDLKINPFNPVIAFKGRSFSEDPLVVTSNASVFIEAMHNYDILCALKHFPGHGSSCADSHTGITAVSHTWITEELLPYEILIQAGYSDFILTAHITNTALDNTVLPNCNNELAPIPLTFSKKVFTDFLRAHLGFQGLVITDDLTMGAIANNYSLEQTLTYSINAGIDMIIFANHSVGEGMNPDNDTPLSNKSDMEKTTLLVDTLESLVLSGKIPLERINQAYGRITAAKSRLRL